MFKVALRANEIASATWAMALTADGTVGEAPELPNKQGGSRNSTQGRTALVDLWTNRSRHRRTASSAPNGGSCPVRWNDRGLGRRSRLRRWIVAPDNRISTYLDPDIPVGRTA
jgi:hypothetical protein